jgi:hypothetical protein
MTKKTFWLILLALLVAAGCTLGSTAPTGDTSTDPSAAQNFLPNVSGYNRTNAKNVTEAISSVSGGAALISGNVVVAAAIAKIDAMVQCYQNVGAVAAAVYTQVNLDQVISGEIPKVGAVAVINQDRLSRNFLNCVIGSASGAFSAQGATVEPCGGSGSKTSNNETLHYLYAGTDPNFCSAVQQHFDSLP